MMPESQDSWEISPSGRLPSRKTEQRLLPRYWPQLYPLGRVRRLSFLELIGAAGCHSHSPAHTLNRVRLLYGSNRFNFAKQLHDSECVASTMDG